MSPKTTMLEKVEHYLICRRKLGFELKIEGQQLLRFARYADNKGHTGPVTIQLAIDWAKLNPRSSRRNCARRLDLIRRFANFQLLYDPETEVPPPGFFGAIYHRPPVHIYTDDQIASLLHLARALGPKNGLRPQTYMTLFGLLASTGLRISEALRLTVQDVDFHQAQLRVREAKFKSSRLLPLHASTVEALRSYDRYRRNYHGTLRNESFFVTETATPLKYWRTLMLFCRLRQTLGWDQFDPCPRIHDLRHTFAVRCLLRWYQAGENVDQRILALQTYLGHKKITDTYWYLSASPELMAQAALRFENFASTGGNL